MRCLPAPARPPPLQATKPCAGGAHCAAYILSSDKLLLVFVRGSAKQTGAAIAANCLLAGVLGPEAQECVVSANYWTYAPLQRADAPDAPVHLFPALVVPRGHCTLLDAQNELHVSRQHRLSLGSLALLAT